MGNRLRNGVAAFVVMSSLIGSGTIVTAQELAVDEGQLNLSYNEQVVEKILREADPDAAFLARLKMMRGHLAAAVMTSEMGSSAEAHEHVNHPSSEILPDITKAMKAHGLNDLQPALNAATKTLSGNDPKAMRAAIDAVLVEISRAEAAISPSKMSAGSIVPDAIILLLRTAAAEYGEAFEYGKIVNMIEYHDGAAFIVEARQLLKHIEPTFAARNKEAWEKLQRSLTTLESAWPTAQPPQASVLPLTKLLALVTIIELQLNRMRGA